MIDDWIWDSDPIHAEQEHCWTWHNDDNALSNGAIDGDYMFVCTGFGWYGVDDICRVPLSWCWT